MDTRALRRLLEILRQAGVTRYKTADVDIELGPAPRRTATGAYVDAAPIEVTTDEPPDALHDLLFAHERVGA